MTAILLAAGVGRRMGANALPKCLLPVGGATLLRMTFDGLRASGTRHVVLVVGYRQEDVMQEARRRAGSLKLTCLTNSRYSEGAILSLWTAREFFEDDLLIMDSDVLCPPVFLERLVRSRHRNCLLVDGSVQDSGEEQIVLGTGDRVLYITKRPSAELKSRMTPFGESVGFLKVSREDAPVLRQLLEAKVAGGATTIEHEELYPEFFERVRVGFERVDRLPWTEIDTHEDLTRAEQVILPQWVAPHCLNRSLATFFLPWITKLPVSPNGWTFLSLLIGCASARFISTGSFEDGLWGALLFQLFYIVDDWDGEVARIKGLCSRWGGWFDVLVDAVVHICLPLALGLGLAKRGGPSWVLAGAVAASMGIFLDFFLTCWAKARGFGPAVFGDPSRGAMGVSHSPLSRVLRVNLTQENFSLLVGGVLLFDWRLPFLLAMAVGTQVFWMRYLLRERHRLL